MVGMIEQVLIYANGLIFAGMMYYAFTCLFKPAVRKIWIFLAFLTFLVATTEPFLHFDNIWITLLTNVVSHIALSFLFSGSISVKIVFSLLIYVSGMLSEGLSIVIINAVHFLQYGYGATFDEIIPIVRTVTTIIHLPLILAIIQGFRIHLNKKAQHRSFSIPMRYTLVVTLMLLGVILLSALFVASTVTAIHYVFWQLTIALLLSAGVIIAIIWLYNTILNHLEEFHKNSLKEQMQERWEVLFHTATSSQKTISALKHNMRYDLVSLSGHLDDNNIPMMKKLLADRIGEVDSVISTGNPSIDTMLNYYQQKAKDTLGIDLELGLLLPANLRINSSLTALILGNALENAVEACEKVPKELRFIRVIAEVTTRRELLMSIKNPYTVSPISDSDGKLITIKEDKQNHGFGLSGINETLSDNVGLTHIKYEDGVFIFKLIFYRVI